MSGLTDLIDKIQAEQAATHNIPGYQVLPPVVPSDPEYRWQRRFRRGGQDAVNATGRFDCTGVSVFRNGKTNVARVEFGSDVGPIEMYARIHLPAHALIELAYRLLDAAHDINTFPAPVDQ